MTQLNDQQREQPKSPFCKRPIHIVGARVNNLKNVTLDIPKDQITIFTGVSGSGKSSIVFETVAQEAGRQVNETYSRFVQGFMPKFSHPDVEAIDNLAMAITVDQKRIGGNSRSTLGTITDINPLLRVLFSRIGTPFYGPSSYFSFNDINGMCKTCEGIGRMVTLDLTKALDMDKSLNEGAILLPGYKPGSWQWKIYASSSYFDPDQKIKDYSEEAYHQLVYQQPTKVNSAIVEGMNSTYMGLLEKFISQHVKTEYEKSDATKEKIAPFTMEAICPDCGGKRYNTAVLDVKVLDYTIADLTAMQVDHLLDILSAINEPKVSPVLLSLKERLGDLIHMGLDYVSLDRETSTLSGGESQRVKMVKHLTSSLTDVIYIFDEPSIGLHPRDVHRLNELLIKLKDKGNTVLVVEHDPDVIKIADYIVDMGPKAGVHGGHVVYQGTYEGLLAAGTLTSTYLNQTMPIKEKLRTPTTFLTSPKGSLHNLKGIALRIPKGLFTVITGVAGSGKSTLVHGVFVPAFQEAMVVDQSAVSANGRSNVATYTGVMDAIRKMFSEAHSVSVGLFSYNSEGACPICKGRGFIETDLSFMDSVETLCEACNGQRYKPEALRYTIQEKTIAQILSMTVAEALEFLTEKEMINKLKHIAEVGLQYITLGQPLDTLSGGECQRLKLAKEFSKKGNIYILDEPTTGLHLSDIQGLLTLINRLVDKGNTVVVIEHHLDVIRSADWLVDLGPEGGINGGQILYEGPPVGLKTCKNSLTGRYL